MEQQNLHLNMETTGLDLWILTTMKITRFLRCNAHIVQYKFATVLEEFTASFLRAVHAGFLLVLLLSPEDRASKFF
jgi:hypothetical protein